MKGPEQPKVPEYVPLQVYSKASVLHGIHATSSVDTLLGRAKALDIPAMALTDPNMYAMGEFLHKAESYAVHAVPGASYLVTVPERKDPVRASAIALNRPGLDFLSYLSSQILAYGKILTPDSFTDRRTGEDIFVYWHGYTSIVDDLKSSDTNFYALEHPTVGTPKAKHLALHQAHLENMIVMPPVTMASVKDLYIRTFLQATHPPSLLPSHNGRYLEESLRTPLQIAADYPHFPEAIKRSAQHAHMSNVRLPKRPESKAKIAGEEDSNDVLSRLVYDALARRQSEGMDSPTLKTRVDHELSLIQALGFSDYILMCYEIAQFCTENGIEYMVSGSANNCVVLWLLGVVKIDPQSLLFERFINAARGDSLPDTDFLLAQSDVARVMNFVSRRYGEEAVRLCTINHLGKSKIISIAKEHDYEVAPDEVDKLVQAQIPEQIGTHASGEALLSHAPIARTGGNVVAAQINAESAEKFWHIYKFDFLASLAMTHIKDTKEMLNRHNTDMVIPPNDSKIYRAILTGHTPAIVFCDTPHLQQVLRDVGSVWKESSLGIVAQALALARMNYEARKKYKENDLLHHPFVKYKAIHQVLADTRLTAIYQDQLLELATDVIGLSQKQADVLRKMMSEKVDFSTKNALLQELTGILSQKEYPAHISTLLTQELMNFTGYGFVEGHALALAFLAYVQACLAILYPEDFWAAVFSRPPPMGAKAKDKFDAQFYVDEFLRAGHTFGFPPTIPTRADVLSRKPGVIVPDPTYFGKRPGKARDLAYQEFRKLIEDGRDPIELIQYQEKHFPVVLTHNPVKQFPERPFDPNATKQLFIGRVTLRRRINDSLYVTLDGSQLVNAVIMRKPLQDMGLDFETTLLRNRFYLMDIGASQNRSDQWVILNIYKDPLSDFKPEKADQ